MNGKIFVALEGITDLDFYQEMQGWKDNDGNNYQLIDALEELKQIDKVDDEVIKEAIAKKVMESSAVAIVIGPKTKSFRKFTRWQIEASVNLAKPIIAININGIRSVDFDRCPTFLKKNLSMHIAAQNEIFEYALTNWISSFKDKKAKEENKNYRYSNDVYDSLGLHTADFC